MATKQIPLPHGLFTLVDEEDYEIFKHKSWNYTGKRKYVRGNYKINGRWKSVLMHQIILPGFKMVDHKDGDTLNNTRSNLRGVTASQNSRNKKAIGKSKYMGVSLESGAKGQSLKRKWVSRITSKGKKIYLGRYDNELDAARAYDFGAKMLGTSEFSRLNNIPGSENFKLKNINRKIDINSFVEL